jgi:glyoxylase-like metal-dependent hydrolase (beta-lactamase superfamily II)
MPYDSSPVNIYLVEDDPLTIVDTGPNDPGSLAQLEQALADLGRRIEDLERVVITHQHIDHFGLASVIVERSGAEVCAIDAVVPWLERYPEHRKIEMSYRAMLMRRHGVPELLIAPALESEARYQAWDPSVPVDHALSAEEVLEFADRRLTVIPRPGHSPFDTVFLDEQRGVLFAGDHLISHISSNPLITPDVDDLDGERPRALMTYRDSLRATRAMPGVTEVLAGHGDRIADHRALIDERFADMDRRRGRIEAALDAGAQTAHQVARSVWNRVAEEQPYLTLSEVLGYVDLLSDEGLVREELSGETIRVVRT